MGATVAIVASALIGAGVSEYGRQENEKYQNKKEKEAKEYAENVGKPNGDRLVYVFNKAKNKGLSFDENKMRNSADYVELVNDLIDTTGNTVVNPEIYYNLSDVNKQRALDQGLINSNQVSEYMTGLYNKGATELETKYNASKPELDTDYYNMWSTKLAELEAPSEQKAIKTTIAQANFLDPYAIGSSDQTKAIADLVSDIQADRATRALGMAESKYSTEYAENRASLNRELATLASKYGTANASALNTLASESEAERQKQEAANAAAMVSLSTPRTQSTLETFSPYLAQLGMYYGMSNLGTGSKTNANTFNPALSVTGNGTNISDYYTQNAIQNFLNKYQTA